MPEGVAGTAVLLSAEGKVGELVGNNEVGPDKKLKITNSQQLASTLKYN